MISLQSERRTVCTCHRGGSLAVPPLEGAKGLLETADMEASTGLHESNPEACMAPWLSTGSTENQEFGFCFINPANHSVSPITDFCNPLLGSSLLIYHSLSLLSISGRSLSTEGVEDIWEGHPLQLAAEGISLVSARERSRSAKGDSRVKRTLMRPGEYAKSCINRQRLS